MGRLSVGLRRTAPLVLASASLASMLESAVDVEATGAVEASTISLWKERKALVKICVLQPHVFKVFLATIHRNGSD